MILQGIKRTPRERKPSLLSHVRNNLDEITDARKSGFSWGDIAAAMRQNKIKATEQKVRTYYHALLRIAEEEEAERKVSERTDTGLQSRESVNNNVNSGVNNSINQSVNNNVNQTSRLSSQEVTDRSVTKEVRPSERVAMLATQPRPAAASALTDANGFVKNIPDDEI